MNVKHIDNSRGIVTPLNPELSDTLLLAEMLSVGSSVLAALYRRAKNDKKTFAYRIPALPMVLLSDGTSEYVAHIIRLFVLFKAFV